jgi:hypothetical protein
MDSNGNRNDSNVSGNMPDPYDRLLGQLDGGLPGVTKTKISTIRVVPPLGVGGSIQTTIQTFRQEGQLEDDVIEGEARRAPARFVTFVQVVLGDKVQRLLLTDDALAVLRRQQDSLTSQAQSRAAKRAAQTRKERGFVPTFGRKKGRAKK